MDSERSRWLILLVLSSALFLVSVDVTVLYIALPIVARDLDTTASQKIWIVSAYFLVVTGLLPGLGALAACRTEFSKRDLHVFSSVSRRGKHRSGFQGPG